MRKQIRNNNILQYVKKKPKRFYLENNEYADWVTTPTFWPRGVRCRPLADKRGNGSDRRVTNPSKSSGVRSF